MVWLPTCRSQRMLTFHPSCCAQPKAPQSVIPTVRCLLSSHCCCLFFFFHLKHFKNKDGLSLFSNPVVHLFQDVSIDTYFHRYQFSPRKSLSLSSPTAPVWSRVLIIQDNQALPYIKWVPPVKPRMEKQSAYSTELL